MGCATAQGYGNALSTSIPIEIAIKFLVEVLNLYVKFYLFQFESEFFARELYIDISARHTF